MRVEDDAQHQREDVDAADGSHEGESECEAVWQADESVWFCEVGEECPSA